MIYGFRSFKDGSSFNFQVFKPNQIFVSGATEPAGKLMDDDSNHRPTVFWTEGEWVDGPRSSNRLVALMTASTFTVKE